MHFEVYILHLSLKKVYLKRGKAKEYKKKLQIKARVVVLIANKVNSGEGHNMKWTMVINGKECMDISLNIYTWIFKKINSRYKEK